MRWTKVLTVGAVASLGLVAACGAPSTNGTGTGNASGDNGNGGGRCGDPRPDRQGPRPRSSGSEEGWNPHGFLLLDPGQHGPERPVLPGHRGHLLAQPPRPDDLRQPRRPAGPRSGPRHRPRQGVRGRPHVDVHPQGRRQVRGRHAGQGRGHRLGGQALVRPRPRRQRSDLPARVLQGRRRVPGPLQGRQELEGRRGHRRQDRSSSTSRSASRRCPTSSRSTSSRRSPRRRTRRATTSCTRWRPAPTCSTSTPRAPS